MPQLSVQAMKSNFFDRDKVTRAMSNAAKRNLSKFGAYVRTDAQRSLRYRDKPSGPGEPPSAHKTMSRTKTNKKGVTKTQSVSPLREFIFFAYDETRKSVVIGPAKLNAKFGNAPHALEYGGESIVRSGSGVQSVFIRPRPFMRPALGRTATKLKSIWENSIKKG